MKKLAIIIPCKNEVKFITQLFDSLVKQTYPIEDIPIYVADANSTDGTLEIIEHYNQHQQLNITIVTGGYPSRARNNGAALANAKYLLFLDADIQLLETDFIEKIVQKADDNQLDCIGTLVKSIQPNWKDIVIWQALFVFMHLYPIFKPFNTGMCVFIRRDKFEALGGFKESVYVGEDIELISNIKKQKFGILKRHILTTNRRFKKMGYRKTMLLYTRVLFSKKYRHRNHAYYFK